MAKQTKGPLERHEVKKFCEMCGATGARRNEARHMPLEPGFNPGGKPMTLCALCRMGSWESLQAKHARIVGLVESVIENWPTNRLAEAVNRLRVALRG
jgi:hypothetical protein